MAYFFIVFGLLIPSMLFIIINRVFLNNMPTIKLMFLSLFTMIIGIAPWVIINDEFNNSSFFLLIIGFFMFLFGVITGISVLKKDLK